MSKNDGGPAFPWQEHGEQGMPVNSGYSGMSLRDWFAGMALQSMGEWTPGPAKPGDPDEAAARKASWAYRIADAMIAARNADSPDER